jgi:regulator of replication initiation timing
MMEHDDLTPYGGLAGLEQRLAQLEAERDALRQRISANQHEDAQLRLLRHRLRMTVPPREGV